MFIGFKLLRSVCYYIFLCKQHPFTGDELWIQNTPYSESLAQPSAWSWSHLLNERPSASIPVSTLSLHGIHCPIILFRQMALKPQKWLEMVKKLITGKDIDFKCFWAKLRPSLVSLSFTIPSNYVHIMEINGTSTIHKSLRFWSVMIVFHLKPVKCIFQCTWSK